MWRVSWWWWLCAVYSARVWLPPPPAPPAPPSPPAVVVAQGAVRGRVSPDGSNHQYFGIPYASSAAQYRFQAPGPAPSWSGELQAVDEHVRCPQRWGHLVVGQEECLVLNVYSPRGAAPHRPLPVMVFIHGGGYKEGSGSRLLYGPDYLVARGVLLVTFNYRLGVLGFLCLGVREAPGNAGLKDQLAALRWVRANIRAFGGDPDNVTIFGESAGAASVSYHLVSRASRGLFRRAVLQSGSSTAPWARQARPLHVAAQLARALGHDGDVADPHRLYQIFRDETVHNLLTAEIPRTRGRLQFTHLPFVPCTERIIDDVEPFITEAPLDILSRGDHNKVPVIIGSNDEEGYYFAAYEDDRSLAELDFERALPLDLDFPSAAERRAAGDETRRLYLGDDRPTWATMVQLSRLHGDTYFTFPALVETELLLLSNDEPVYSYIFEHDGWRNFAKLISGPSYWSAGGATHADELFYLFSLFPTPTLFETDMISTMTQFWTNFAKYGAPGVVGDMSWEPGAAPLRLGGAPRSGLYPRPPLASLAQLRPREMHFWRTLYDKYRTRRLSDLD